MNSSTNDFAVCLCVLCHVANLVLLISADTNVLSRTFTINLLTSTLPPNIQEVREEASLFYTFICTSIQTVMIYAGILENSNLPRNLVIIKDIPPPPPLQRNFDSLRFFLGLKTSAFHIYRSAQHARQGAYIPGEREA